MSLGLIFLWSFSLVYFLFPSGCSEETEDQPLPPGMVLVPAGKFRMGSTTGDVDERPVHTVDVDAFYIDLHERQLTLNIVSLSKLLTILHLAELDTPPNMASLITIISRGRTLALTNQINP